LDIAGILKARIYQRYYQVSLDFQICANAAGNCNELPILVRGDAAVREVVLSE
jgi:hypothetical protein